MDRGAGARLRPREVALAVGAFLVVAGCAPPTCDLLLRHDATDFPGQIVRGTLAGDPPCRGLMSSRGWTVLAWPTRARATVDRTVVVELDGRVAAAATTIELAGGFVEQDSAYEGHLVTHRVVERCPADAYFFVTEIGPG
jgi:hypothetical protein